MNIRCPLNFPSVALFVSLCFFLVELEISSLLIDEETMRRKVREIEEKQHRASMLERERLDGPKKYGDDMLARVRAYEKESVFPGNELS